MTNLDSQGIALWTVAIADFAYEELLALDERVEAVGLSAEDITGGTMEARMTMEELTTLRANGEADCKICLCDYEVAETVRRLPCLHVFHADCVDQHFRHKKNCPICRADVIGFIESIQSAQSGRS